MRRRTTDAGAGATDERALVDALIAEEDLPNAVREELISAFRGWRGAG